MVVATSHITAQRGHEVGIAAKTAAGNTINGSQLSHAGAIRPAVGAARSCAATVGTFELMVSIRVALPSGCAT